jgi:hypothetical protein
MRIGIEEVRNLLLNYSYEESARYITEHAENAVGSMQMLDRAALVMDMYKKELSEGQEFLNVYARHNFANSSAVPNIGKRAKNLSKALFKFVVNGLPIATREEAQRKLAICEGGCEYFDGSICRHTDCGCFAKIKTFFETEKCPIGKW